MSHTLKVEAYAFINTCSNNLHRFKLRQNHYMLASYYSLTKIRNQAAS